MMALTAELVARYSRAIEDAGPATGLKFFTDQDYEDLRDTILLQRAAENSPVWVFAYGSLLWDPCFEWAEERNAVAPGWHRRFSFWLTRWRGTREHPGLMMALDRGGCCKGVVYRIGEGNEASAIDCLLRREMAANPPTNVPRWITAHSGGAHIKALAFVVDPRGPAYASGLSEEKTVEVLSLAAGHVGSCAEYLHKTIVQLEARGIRDGSLWRLQQKVAQYLTADRSEWPSPAIGEEVNHACEG